MDFKLLLVLSGVVIKYLLLIIEEFGVVYIKLKILLIFDQWFLVIHRALIRRAIINGVLINRESSSLLGSAR